MKPQTSKHSACLTTLLLVLLNMGWLPDATAGPAVYYFHNDHLGTPRVVTDRLRDVRWRADYTPFGETIMHTEQIEMPLRMPGQYYDSESGLHYNYYRDYDPGLGRYIQSDPIGLLGGLNTYVYARNDPLSRIDPFGLHGQMSRIKGTSSVCVMFTMRRSASRTVSCRLRDTTSADGESSPTSPHTS